MFRRRANRTTIRAAKPAAAACANPSATTPEKKCLSMQHLVGRPAGNHVSTVQQKSSIRKPPRLLAIMADQHTSDPLLVCDVLDHGFDLELRGLVQGGGGFVQQ